MFVDQAQKNFVTQLLRRQYFEFEKFHQRIKKISRTNSIQVPTVDLTESDTYMEEEVESMGVEDHMVRKVNKAST